VNSTLNTNEIKNSAGVEEEFINLSKVGRTGEWKLITESPALPHRLKVSHQESGSGIAKRRRGVIRFDKTVYGQVDTTKFVTFSAYVVLDIPVGNITLLNEAKNVMANLMSLLATTGAATTVLFDNTGNGADALVNGTV